ncbi:hypothetical protein IT570_03100 [Candidatus Sumerlaeota bacterium]|nr:hypothetical protein [Candidatus Sumerlaeota bacterium]
MSKKEKQPPQPANAEENNAKMAMKTIRQEINRILCNWDPLAMRGLKGFETAYSDHVGPIIVLLKKGAKPMEICVHLDRLVQQEWKLPESREQCLDVAEKIHRVGSLFRLGA